MAFDLAEKEQLLARRFNRQGFLLLRMAGDEGLFLPAPSEPRSPWIVEIYGPHASEPIARCTVFRGVNVRWHFTPRSLEVISPRETLYSFLVGNKEVPRLKIIRSFQLNLKPAPSDQLRNLLKTAESFYVGQVAKSQGLESRREKQSGIWARINTPL